VETAGRLLPCSRNTQYATRFFLFSPLPHFAFISCAHQTTFLKKKKTYGKFFVGTNSGRDTFSSKNLIFELKMSEKMDCK